jgi:FkbM family methyltransferase
MKLKSLVWTLGLKPKPKKYGTRRIQFDLAKDGRVEFEKWLHPKDGFHPFPQDYVSALREYLQEGDTAIDIGAHCGDFTIPLALAAGATGAVFAWEPNPYVFEVLEANAQLNRDKTNILPVCAAAGPVESVLSFHYSDPGFCNGGNLQGINRWKHGHAFSLTVQALRVDDWMRKNHPERIDRLRFVKVDAEGFDLQVLQSMEELLRRQHPVMHVEFYRHLQRHQRETLWSFIDSLGYRIFSVGELGCEPVDRIQQSDVMKWEHFDTICIANDLSH